jgi:SAM-dependent methyltransferase
MASATFETVRVCDVCGSTEQRELYDALDLNQGKEGTFKIRQCTSCGLAFLSPRPDVASIADYYPDEYWRGYVEKDQILSGYKELYDNIRKMPPGKMLDIGTGGAYFLSLFDDWDRVGTELSAKTASKASKQYGIPVYAGLLEDNVANGNLKAGSFDLITLNGVLEHLYTPRQTLNHIHKLLRPGGTVAISVQNFDSLSSKLTKSKWYHLDPPRHFYHFSPANLQQLLESEGFEVTETSHFNKAHNEAGYKVSFSRLVDGKPALIRKPVRLLVRLTGSVAPRLFSMAGRGDVITSYGRKH